MKARIAARISEALERQRSDVRPFTLPEINERHYSAAEIAQWWNLDVSTVRRMFRDVPGVLRLGETGFRRGKQREHVTLRVPESVLKQFYRERIR